MGILKEQFFIEVEIKTSNIEPIETKYNKKKQIDQVTYVSSEENQNWFFVWMNSPLSEHQKERLGYLAVFQLDEEGGFVASIPTLNGCITEGDTLEETRNYLQDTLCGWIQVALEKNLSIPNPDGKIPL